VAIGSERGITLGAWPHLETRREYDRITAEPNLHVGSDRSLARRHGVSMSLAAVVPATVRTLWVGKEEEMWQDRGRSPVSLASS
jgi:hypothetical protein